LAYADQQRPHGINYLAATLDKINQQDEQQRIRRLGEKFLKHGDYSPEGLKNFATSNKLSLPQMSNLVKTVAAFNQYRNQQDPWVTVQGVRQDGTKYITTKKRSELIGHEVVIGLPKQRVVVDSKGQPRLQNERTDFSQGTTLPSLFEAAQTRAQSDANVKTREQGALSRLREKEKGATKRTLMTIGARSDLTNMVQTRMDIRADADRMSREKINAENNGRALEVAKINSKINRLKFDAKQIEAKWKHMKGQYKLITSAFKKQGEKSIFDGLMSMEDMEAALKANPELFTDELATLARESNSKDITRRSAALQALDYFEQLTGIRYEMNRSTGAIKMILPSGGSVILSQGANRQPTGQSQSQEITPASRISGNQAGGLTNKGYELPSAQKPIDINKLYGNQ
jgi:hypothetical protein